MTCGIYEIVNRVNGKRYVGSSVDIEKRFQTHMSELRRGNHHAQHLQRSYVKYGEENFYLNILLECARESLIKNEQVEIDMGADYNSSPTAQSTLGMKFSPEARARVRKNRLDRYAADPEGFSAMMSSITKGKPKSAAWKQKMSEAMSKAERTTEWCEAMARGRAVLSKDQVLEVRRLRLEGLSLNDISSKTEISWHQCRRICAGERYQWAYDFSGPVPFDAYASRRKKKAPEGA